MKLLFVLKKRDHFNPEKDIYVGLSSGLHNSVSFIVNMLVASGVKAVLSVVNDNNDIDREITINKPNYVIIEALWVVPEKFKVLAQLHPSVKWIVRLHSEISFIAGEGIAMGWIAEYLKHGVSVACNSPRMAKEVRYYVKSLINCGDKIAESFVPLLTNYYPMVFKHAKPYLTNSDILNVGCFGAIRPLKNQLIQAMGALRLANHLNKKLYFHINYDRIEMGGNPILHNLRDMFKSLEHRGHILVNHEWEDHEEFKNVCRGMDIGMQVSFTETFNIVGADIISEGVPLVGSDIPWMDKEYLVDIDDSENIYKKMLYSYDHNRRNVADNQKSLKKYCETTQKMWISMFKK